MTVPISRTPPRAAEAPSPRERWVALAGNPNTGKTAVFNAITGLRQKVGNYPGVTVERKVGKLRLPSGRLARCVDLPGCYSLVARSQDEQVAHDVLVGQVEEQPPLDLVVLVVDASNLQRNLYLVSQILDLGLPAVVALNMSDVAVQAGLTVDVPALSERLGVPVVPTVAVREKGIDTLLEAVDEALQGMDGEPAHRERPWRMGESVEERVAELAAELRRHRVKPERADAEAIWLLSSLQEADELAGINPHVREQVLAAQRDLEERGTPFRSSEIEARYAWIDDIAADCVEQGERKGSNWTARLDAVFTHRVLGPLVFLFVMTLVFQSIFAWADPAIGLVEDAFGSLSEAVRSALPPGAFRDLLTDGIIAGAGNVVVFLPQILLLFFAIGLLEDTGYMARAAYLMDRIMGRVGLHGRAFIPLLSSFACAIPGIMATRTIENRRDRLVTILVAPLMSCSARLPVYALVIAALFDANRRVAGIFTVGGLVLTTMYVLSVVAAITMAFVFKRTLLRGPRPALILEMPPYKRPQLKSVLREMWQRSKLFLQRAGTVILAVTILLWGLLAHPKDVALSRDYGAERAAVEASAAGEAAHGAALAEIDSAEAAERLQRSYGGRLGQLIEPLIRPLGFDWKIGIGLVGSFAAREVLVSTLGVVYGVGDADEESAPLRERLRSEKRPDGSPVYTPLVGVSLMVFFVLACQCMSTLAVVRRETGGWKWPAFMWAYMTVLAWVGAFVVYQGGRWLGFA